MARIMVVDDDEGVVRLIKRALRHRDFTVTAARNGLEALQLLESQKPDIVVLDVMMPKINGFQVCQHMRTNPALASIPILFLTARETVEDKIAGFEAGADDYVTKPFHLGELELRLKSLLRRAIDVSPGGRLTIGRLCLDPDALTVEGAGEPVRLTRTEFALLYYLASHAGEVISTERLLQEVWSYLPGTGNQSLVRMHVLNLRRKIEKDPQCPTILCTVPRHGYVVRATDAD